MTTPSESSRWRKSTRSQSQGACVELHPTGAVRDSKNPTGPTLTGDLGALLSAARGYRITR